MKAAANKQEEMKQIFEKMEKYSSVLANYIKNRKEFFDFWKGDHDSPKKVHRKDQSHASSKQSNRSASRMSGNSEGTESKRRSLTAQDLKEDEKHILEQSTKYQPKFIKNCVLKDHQIEGLNWLIDIFKCNANGILADQMGLGKTVQSISMLAYMREVENIRGPHLIVCPLTVTNNWKSEFAKYFPDCKTMLLSAKMDERDEHIEAYKSEVSLV